MFKAVCSGAINKTAKCPGNGCERVWTGEPKTVNKLKSMHIKVCQFIPNEYRTELQNMKCLKTLKPDTGTAHIRDTLVMKDDESGFVQTEEIFKYFQNEYVMETSEIHKRVKDKMERQHNSEINTDTTSNSEIDTNIKDIQVSQNKNKKKRNNKNKK